MKAYFEFLVNGKSVKNYANSSREAKKNLIAKYGNNAKIKKVKNIKDKRNCFDMDAMIWEIDMADMRQAKILRNHALKNEEYFLAEYYEHLSKSKWRWCYGD